jgi:hypothetical protein
MNRIETRARQNRVVGDCGKPINPAHNMGTIEGIIV